MYGELSTVWPALRQGVGAVAKLDVMRSSSLPVLGFVAALAIALGGAGAQDARPTQAPIVAASPPFSIGEKLTYNAKVNFLHVGTGVMTVVGIDTVRGHTTYHTAFDVHGRMLFYSVNDHYEDWLDTTTMASLRY